MTNYCSAVRSLINVMAYSVRNRTCRDREIPQRPADSSQLPACPLSTTSSSTTFTMGVIKADDWRADDSGVRQNRWER